MKKSWLSAFIFLICLFIAVGFHEYSTGVNCDSDTNNNIKSIIWNDEVDVDMFKTIIKPKMRFKNTEEDCEYCHSSPTCIINVIDTQSSMGKIYKGGICEECANECFYCGKTGTTYLDSNLFGLPIFMCEECYNSLISS